MAEMVPEIMRTSLTSAVLALKALPLDIDVLTFDFLDQPKVGRDRSRKLIAAQAGL